MRPQSQSIRLPIKITDKTDKNHCILMTNFVSELSKIFTFEKLYEWTLPVPGFPKNINGLKILTAESVVADEKIYEEKKNF